MRAALVKKHPALLVHQGLQELEFGFGKLNLGSDGGHKVVSGNVRRSGRPHPDSERSRRERDWFRGLLESLELRPMQQVWKDPAR